MAAEAAEEGSEESGAPPLPDDRFSTFELAAHAVLLTAFALPALAYLLDLFAGWPLLWDRIVVDIVAPVISEAGGDSDYNLLDTVVYALLLASFVFALSAWLRRARLPAHERTLFVFLPWVVWAAMVEVAEDAGLISASIQTLFVSPLIHFQTACWVVLSGALAYYLTRDSDSERTSEMCLRVAVGVMVLHLLFLHDLSGEGAFDLLAGSVGILTILASLPIIRFRGLVSHWSGVEQGVFLSGLTSVALAFGLGSRDIAAEQMRRWRQIDDEVDALSVAAAVYRTDIHRDAARRLGMPVPDEDGKSEGHHDRPWMLRTQTGDIAMGSDRFFGGQTFVTCAAAPMLTAPGGR